MTTHNTPSTPRATIFTVGRDTDFPNNIGRFAIYDGAQRIVGGYRSKRTALEEAARMTREAAPRAQHTPGPWRVYRADNFGRPDTKSEAVAVAGIVVGGWGVAEDMANARLIAEAPAMLAELRQIRNLTIYNLRTLARKRDREAVAGDVINRIDALIARIDGQEGQR